MKRIFDKFQIITILIGFVVVVLLLIPRFFGIVPYIVLSGSMEKEIRTGSVAYVNTKFNREDIKVGDIIAFSVGQSQVTHRVVSINDDNTYTTKGDANDTVDLKNVKFKNYRGKTIFSIPYIGYIVRFTQTKLGYCIIGMLVLFNLTYIIFCKDDKNDSVKIKKNKHVKAGS